jgi:hypothetical protein
MNGFNRILSAYLCHYSKLFWLLFTLAGAIFISTVLLGFVSLFYLEIILGVALVVVGIHMLGEEFSHRSIRKSQDDSVRAINELLQWAEKSYDYTRAFKDRHERRIYRLDHKRAEHEKKVEEQFRSAVKKIIEMENKLNKAVRSLEQEKDLINRLEKMARELLKERQLIEGRVLDLSQTQLSALQFLRKHERMTNKDYRQQFKVSDKKAYNELMALIQKGLIKRQGKGRTTHYVLAF